MADIEFHKPRYWTDETSGFLQPAIEAFCNGYQMTPNQITTMRAYLRQWIDAPAWQGPAVDELRKAVNGLTSRQAIADWLAEALREGIDPL
ncbi:hypothetical protein GR217_34300 [Rhizobium leguminosarum]|uniref:Uncharacterized protein n=1 Tax=Rhizobium ruizarguesonis TaxID=2081791 RepID=A0AAE5C692_9HYPH|nr:hypothetical protein [Rhizobium ruizarguesonis]NEI52692.1 hypothetical protein [Rhizobium ruizarguesonis]